MRTALLGKAALCVCPPVMLATTVATVPPVRKAVHTATRPHHPITHHPLVRPAAFRPVGVIGPCGGTAAPVPLLTLADLGPQELAVEPVAFPDGSGGPGDGGPGGGGLVPATGGVPPVIGTGTVSPVPEPATWLMLIAGLGAAGVALRFGPRRRYRVQSDRAGTVLTPVLAKRRFGAAAAAGAAPVAAGTIWSGLLAGRANSQGSTGAVAKAAAIGSKGAKTALLAKVAMCVCPPAAMIAGTAAIPTVRNAVYNATAPAPVSTALPVGTVATPPCAPAAAPMQITVPEAPLTTRPTTPAPVTPAPVTAHVPGTTGRTTPPAAPLETAVTETTPSRA